MLEECHWQGVFIRIDHHIQREALRREVAVSVGQSPYSTIESQTSALRDVAGVGETQHLEVVHLREVIAGNRLREGNGDVVANAQHSIHRLRRAEELRTARVLHTCQDRR